MVRKRFVCLLGVFLCFCLPVAATATDTGNTIADVTFVPGSLSLTELSTFTFGTQDIISEFKSYPVQETNVALEVHDLRGSGAGWQLTALASRFNDGGNDSLPGATISLLNGSVTSTGTGMNPPSLQPNIVLDCDGASSDVIAEAGSNFGMGNWTLGWNGPAGNNTNVTLDIPGGVATAGTHTVTITWTLADAP